MPAEFIVSQKGSRKLAIDGYQYVVNKRNKGGFELWECDKRKPLGCNARAKTHGDNIVVPPDPDSHSHAPNLRRVETAKIMERIKTRAGESQDSARVLITQESRHASAAVHIAMTEDPLVRRTIQRERARNFDFPVNPTRFADVIFEPEFELTTAGEPFKQYDTGRGPNRIVIFISPAATVNLAEASNWFCDGTFSVCPDIGVHQLFTVHAMVGDRVFPCAYGLLPNKRQATYEEFFLALQDISGGVFEPRWIMTDFELAQINAIKDLYPDAEMQGCFFHLKQACYRNIQSLHLVNQYADNEEFGLRCRNVDERYEPPRYPIELWNQYDNAISDHPRTNNCVEGWHRAFQLSVGAKHPAFWKFVDKIKEEEDATIRKRNQQAGGHAPEAQKKKYKDMDVKIRRQVANYNPDDVVNYLRLIAHNIEL